MVTTCVVPMLDTTNFGTKVLLVVKSDYFDDIDEEQ